MLSILPEDIRAEVRRIKIKKAEEINWMLAEAMQCRPYSNKSRLRSTKFRDDEAHKETQLWFFDDIPFMTCDTWMDSTRGQLMFNLRRLDDAPKIITL